MVVSFIRAERFLRIMEQPASEEVFEEGNVVVVVARQDMEAHGIREAYTREVVTIELKTLPFGIRFGLSMEMETANSLQDALFEALTPRPPARD